MSKTESIGIESYLIPDAVKQAHLKILPVEIAVKADYTGFTPEIVIFIGRAVTDIRDRRVFSAVNDRNRSIYSRFRNAEAPVEILIDCRRAEQTPALKAASHNAFISEFISEQAVGLADIPALNTFSHSR